MRLSAITSLTDRLCPSKSCGRELNRRGKTPDPEHYEVTYYADLPAMWQDVPDNEVLEELFQMFNLSRPQDFEGHSLSVSDVIALRGIALFFEIHQHRRAFRLLVQKPL